MNAKRSKQDLDSLKAALNSLTKASDKMTEVAEKNAKAFDDVARATSEATKATKVADSEYKKLRDNIEDAGDDLGDLCKKMRDYKDDVTKLKKAAGFKSSISLEIDGYDEIEKSITHYTSQLQEAQKNLRALEASGTVGDPLKNAQKGVRDLSQRIRGLEKDFDNVKERADTALKIDRTPARAIGNIREAITGMGSAFGALRKSPGEFADHMERAKASAAGLKGSSAVIGKMPGLLGAAGKAASGMASALGGVTKVLAGWPGMVAMAVVQIVQAGIKIDSYIKGMNKRFAAIRGPDIMTTDIIGQFRDFNKAITNMAANIRDGLTSDDVYEFMAAIGIAGNRLTTLNEGFYGYRDAVNVAAKASKVFGMDMATVGAMMGKLTTDYRMDLEEMDDAFVNVAFDAQKSGLSTDRFWEAISNASASLSFYGSFIDGASKAMKEFTQSQLTGAKDSGDAVTEMGQLFKKSAMETNMAFIAIARRGGANLKKMFTDLETKYEAEAESKGEEVKILEQKYLVTKDPGTLNALETARKEQAKYQQMSRRAADARGRGDVAMAQDMAMLSEQTPALLYDLMKGMTGANITTLKSGNQMAAIMKGIQGVLKGGVSDETVRLLIAKAQQSADELRNLVGIGTIGEKNEKSFVKLLKKVNSNGIAMKAITKDMDKDQLATLDANFARLGETLDPKEQETLLSKLRNQTGLTDDQLLKEMANQRKILPALETINSNLSAEEFDALAKTMSKSLGVDESQAKLMIKAGSSDKNFLTELKSLVKSSNDGNLKSEGMARRLEKLIAQGDMGTKLEQTNLKSRDVAETTLQKAYDDTFDKIRNSTLSLEEMKKIAMDDIKYRTATWLDLDKIAANTAAIAQKLAPEIYSKPQKEAAEALTKAGINVGQQVGGIGKIIFGIFKRKPKAQTEQTALFEALQKSVESGNIVKTNEEMISTLDSINKSIDAGTKINIGVSDKLGKLSTLDEKSAYAQYSIMKEAIKGASLSTGKMIGVIEAQEKSVSESMAKLKGKKDPYSQEQIKRLQGMQVALEASKNGQDASMDLYEDTLKNIQKIKKSGKGDTKILEEQLAILSKVIEGSVDPDTFKDKSQKQIKELKNQSAVNQKIKDDADGIVTNLKMLNIGNEQLASIMTASLAGNKEANQYLLDMAKEKLKVTGKKTASASDLELLYGKSLSVAMMEAAKNLDKTKMVGGQEVIQLDVDTGTGTPEVSKAKIETKQGIITPEQVTRAGAVVLHPKETILPASMSDFASTPSGNMKGLIDAILKATPTTAPATPVEKNITISVNATEKDLAQRIANEIRGYFYREHVNNQA